MSLMEPLILAVPKGRLSLDLMGPQNITCLFMLRLVLSWVSTTYKGKTL